MDWGSANGAPIYLVVLSGSNSRCGAALPADPKPIINENSRSRRNRSMWKQFIECRTQTLTDQNRCGHLAAPRRRPSDSADADPRGFTNSAQADWAGGRVEYQAMWSGRERNGSQWPLRGNDLLSPYQWFTIRTFQPRNNQIGKVSSWSPDGERRRLEDLFMAE